MTDLWRKKNQNSWTKNETHPVQVADRKQNLAAVVAIGADNLVKMLSKAVTSTHNRAPHLGSLAAAASIGASIIFHRKKDRDDETILVDKKPPPAVNDMWLRLCSIDSTVLSDAKFNIPRNRHKYCSCESPFSYLSRRETLRWLDKTTSNATLESRYKVRRCHTYYLFFLRVLPIFLTCFPVIDVITTFVRSTGSIRWEREVTEVSS